MKQEAFFGRAFAITIDTPDSPYTAAPELGRVQRIKAVVLSLVVRLPQVSYVVQGVRRTRFTPGYPVLIIWNPSGGAAYEIQDSDGNTLLASLDPGDMAKCSLIDNTTDAGTWDLTVKTVGSAEQSPVPYFVSFGGETDSDNITQRYDPNLEVWSAGDSFPANKPLAQRSTCFTIAGAGYIASGSQNLFKYTDDAITNTLTARPKSQDSGNGAEPSSKGAVYESSSSDDRTDYVHSYEEDTWTQLGFFPFTNSFNYPACASEGDYVWMHNSAFGSAANSLKKHDFLGDSYSGFAAPPAGERDNAGSWLKSGSFFINDGNLAINGAVLDSHEEWDVVGEAWSTRTADGLLRREHAAAKAGSKGYTTHGNEDDGGFPTTHDELKVWDPSTLTWSTKDPVPSVQMDDMTPKSTYVSKG